MEGRPLEARPSKLGEGSRKRGNLTNKNKNKASVMCLPATWSAVEAKAFGQTAWCPPPKQWWGSWSAAKTTGIEGHGLQANRAVSSSSGDKGPEIYGS